MKFDEVMTVLGEFGPYQRRIYFLLCLPAITGCMQTLIYVFTMATPDHRCAIPGLENDTYEIQDEYHAAIVNASFPDLDACHVTTGVFNVTTVFSQNGIENVWTQGQVVLESSLSNISRQYTVLDNDLSATGEKSDETKPAEDGKSGRQMCSKYVYDKSVFETTIVTQMNLVCEHENFPALAQMLFFVGTIVATCLCQPPSDLIGRKKMLMVGLLLHAVASLAIAWATYFPVLAFLMFLNGLASLVVFANSFIIGMEFVGPSKRVYAGYVIEIFWCMGMILLVPIAYFLRDWQHLQIAASVVPFAFLSYYWLIPESPRWLLSKGRIQEAEKILRHAARVNKVLLAAGVLDDKSLTVDSGQSVWRVFRHPVLLARCAVLFYSWFVCSLAFYGLGLNVGSLSGSVYVNFLLSGVMELLAYVLCICLLDRLGRRLLNSALLLLAGIACTLTIVTVLYASKSLQWTTTALAMIGKLGIAGGFATVWVYSSELFPTVIRSSGMGASSFCARIGSIISPYISSLSTVIEGDTGTAVPLLIFGLSSILAGCLLLTLPETLNRRLPETIEDAINFTKQPIEMTAGGYQAKHLHDDDDDDEEDDDDDDDDELTEKV